MIEVEKGVPLPKCAKRGPIPKYPWNEMNPGDSFAIKADSDTSARRASQAAYRISQARGWQMFCRTRTENGERVVRVWRVE